jgi:2-polyprenyl-6-methoxyphenol hydroxylase-like FAD-dependent oxidoreductase
MLRRVGIVTDHSIGVVPKGRTCLDSSGKVVLEIERLRVVSSWGRIYRALKDAFPVDCYHFSKSLQRFEETAQGITAIFADGSRIDGDLLVGADGSRSTVRKQMLPEVELRYAGYVCWRGLVDEAEMPPELHAQLFERAVMCLPEGELMSAYPVPGPGNDIRPGYRSYNYVWYHPVDGNEGLRALLTDAAGRYHENGIPPHLIRAEAIAQIRAVARRKIAPQFVQVLELTRQPFFQPIYDLESPCMARGRVALLGDAAFVARPHVGMGVTKAGLDAECLADALSDAGRNRAGARRVRQGAVRIRAAGGRTWPLRRRTPRSATEQAARAANRA